MNDLPLAAFLATDLVQRQFRNDESVTAAVPVRPVRQPVRRTRAAVADALEWAARTVAPAGYHLAH